MMDDSFRRPGRIPFQWEIRPGVPKPQHQPTLAASPPPPTSKLSPPPCMTPPSLSPQWSRSLSNSYSPPLPSQSLTRSPSPQHSILGSPSSTSRSNATATIFYRSASASPSKRRSDPTRRSSKAPAATAPKVISVSSSCFPVPSVKRKDNKRSIFASPHHSASSRSSASFSSPFRGSLFVRDEAEVAASWFF
ncbi:hypothetical protein OPV22_022286 [Ensete ventricosum]|uniref:REJ domain-containing protein n=1 Tax=Ensete ventricosum TaxID=4639 RepID=A0AAV8QP19_ENSVE|nr:hypothetical protein OPV22_022286 [Ensete ventricosum]RWW55640.1 hypothetical protein BHE74_00037717 [Ensete ventricosum]